MISLLAAVKVRKEISFTLWFSQAIRFYSKEQNCLTRSILYCPYWLGLVLIYFIQIN